MIRSVPVCVLLVTLLSPSCIRAADPSGYIHAMVGSVTIIRGAARLPASVGAPLFRGDTVVTGRPGGAGIVLTDDGSVSLGPGSEFSLKGYDFSPREGRLGLVARLVKGTFSYLSGLIARLAPDAVRIETPDATIAVRGTRLLVSVE